MEKVGNRDVDSSLTLNTKPSALQDPWLTGTDSLTGHTEKFPYVGISPAVTVNKRPSHIVSLFLV